MLDNDDLLRYSWQLMLPGLDVAGQEALARAAVLLVGLGGLGSACGQYLAAAGVGRLVLADGDTVELSNLHRQVVHREAGLGQGGIRRGDTARPEQSCAPEPLAPPPVCR